MQESPIIHIRGHHIHHLEQMARTGGEITTFSDYGEQLPKVERIIFEKIWNAPEGSDLKICVIATYDDICAVCPLRRNDLGECQAGTRFVTETEFAVADTEMAASRGLTIGEILSAEEFIKRTKMIQNWLKSMAMKRQ